MKPENDKLRPLLNELLTPGKGVNGPNCAEVLGMVRAERTRRLQWQMLGTAALAIVGTLVFLLVQNNSKTPQVAAPVVPQPAQQLVAITPEPAVKRITDDELLLILKDTPSALLEWPNGDRTLLIVEHQAGDEEW